MNGLDEDNYSIYLYFFPMGKSTGEAMKVFMCIMFDGPLRSLKSN